MMDFISYISSIPNVIWSGVIAAFIALVGVVLSNKGNNKRLKTQLTHDGNEKHKERVSALRKEIYLQAADEVALASNFLVTTIHGDINNIDMRSDLKGVTTALARLVIVADLETTKISNKFGSHFGLLMLKILQAMLPMQKLNDDIKLIEQQLSAASDEISRLLVQITEIEKNNDQKITAPLRTRHIELSDIVQSLAAAQDEAYDQYREKSKVINELLLPDIIELSRIQLQLMISIRQDLGIVTDVAELQRQLEHQWVVLKAGYSNAISSAEI